MSALPTRIEKEAGRPLTPLEIFDITAARETTLSRLLMLYISTGLIFMLPPGTFLGVWNLIAISTRRSADFVSPAWIQAHGHAQIFGWIGTFILGIGFYSIPKLRRLNAFALSTVWSAWALWTSGVALRWLTSAYQWHWRALLPLSATLEVVAFVIFFRTVSGHRPQDSGKDKLDEWVLVVIAGSVGFLLTLLINLGATFSLALRSASPNLPPDFDQRFLVLQTCGFLVPFVWGFSAKWLPVFLGLPPIHGRVLLAAVGLNSAGVLAALAGLIVMATVLLLAGIVVAAYVEMFLGTLEAVAQTIDSPPTGEIGRALESALRYFEQAAPKHTADEEESLFPRLRQVQHPEIQSAFSRLEQLEEEHRWAAPLHARVACLGAQYLAAGSLSSPEVAEFRKAVASLASMYREHIRFEDQFVFPLAVRVLSDADKSAIADEMAARRNVRIAAEPR